MSPPGDTAGSSSGPHRMRISSGGSISSYVNFAVKFLQASFDRTLLLIPADDMQDNADRPLVIHTLPPDPPPTGASGTGTSTRPNKSTSTLLPSTLSTPKLVSVVELVKRTYMEYLHAQGVGKGKNKAVGIWQYTQSGLLPLDMPVGDADGHVDGGLTRALAGKTKCIYSSMSSFLSRRRSHTLTRHRPKMTHHPYLQITLSTRPLGLEQDRDTTCQYLMVRRRRPRSGKTAQVGPVPIAAEEGGKADAFDIHRLEGISEPRARQSSAGKEKQAVTSRNETEIAASDQKSADGEKKRKAGSQEDRLGKRKKRPSLRSRG